MTIPASRFVKINPGVVNAGGAGLVLNGLQLTQNLAIPTRTVLSFGSQAAVAAFFGPNSAEAARAGTYFLGYKNATLSPSAILFAPYNLAARAAFLTSGSFKNVSLAQLNAIAAGTLTVNFDGAPLTSGTITPSGFGSFTAAAAAIQAAFTTPGFTVAWNAVTSTFVFLDATTGASSTIVFATGTNNLAVALLLTSGSGAQLSQGDIADTPASAMANVVAVSQNWVSMKTCAWEPTLSQKEAFAVWFNNADDAYLFLAWDSDTQASVQNATEPFGVAAIAAEYNGVACIGGDPAAVPMGSTLAALVESVADFVAGAIASINFANTNGRVTLTFLSQNGLLPTCANDQTGLNLIANGYSYYGSVATRNQGFIFFNNSNMPGQFPWIDTFVDDAWMLDQFQVSLLTLLTTIGSIAYNAPGYGDIRTTLVGGPIAAALNFGAIRTGVKLSASQIADVNQQAGQAVDQIISTQGYYLQILDPGATVRQERGSPVINFWYTDGSAVQFISMSSLDIL